MYICHTCEHASGVKLGKCPSCGEFGTFIKDTFSEPVKGTKKQGEVLTKTSSKTSSSKRPINTPEFSRVLGDTITQGGLYLLGGEPGIGKSTFILQLIQDLSKTSQLTTGYFSGEEMASQITERGARIGLTDATSIDIYHTTSLENILHTTKENGYDCIIIDSIQMIQVASSDSLAGSPSQVKACSEILSDFCKDNNVCCWIIGHMTKGGEIAGPKYLEHLVDVVLHLEGEKRGQYRFLRCKKNRFGATDEIGVIEMGEQGFIPVYDMHEKMLSMVNTDTPGTVLSVGIDNGRALLISIEVLLNKSSYKFPQRNVQGVEASRINMIIAILEKYLNIKVGFFDIYVNIPGEFSFRDNGLDLAIAAAIYSQAKNITIPKEMVFIGELGLGGQVLASKFQPKRLKEAQAFTVIDNSSLQHLSGLGGKL